MTESRAFGSEVPMELRVRLDPPSGSAGLSTKSLSSNVISESTEPVTERVGHVDRIASAPEPSSQTDSDTHRMTDRGEPAVTAGTVQVTTRIAGAVDAY